MYLKYIFGTAISPNVQALELSSHTNYALRVLIYLGVRFSKRAQVADIALLYGISPNNLAKVVHHLALAGFIDSYRGHGGGIALARDPAAIRIGEVVRCTEGEFCPVECFRVTNRCIITGACTLPPILSEAFLNFLNTFDQYTLADLVTSGASRDQIFERRRPAVSQSPSRRLLRRKVTGTKV